MKLLYWLLPFSIVFVAARLLAGGANLLGPIVGIVCGILSFPPVWVRLKIADWLKWGVLALGAMATVSDLPDNMPTSQSVVEVPKTAPEPVSKSSLSYEYEILSKETPGNFANYRVLVDTSSDLPLHMGVMARYFKERECVDLPCNSIEFWDNREAYDLYQQKQSGAEWRRKNWPFICEHNVGDYIVSVGELVLLPLMDSEYRRWGGKKKRPIRSSYNL